MITIQEKIEASIMLASYFETLGYKNGEWEFNFNTMQISTLNNYNIMWIQLLHHYISLGGNDINIKKWNSSDDTILILSTANGIIKGGDSENYKKAYLDNYDFIFDDKRLAGLATKASFNRLKRNEKIPITSEMGGNGAAIRTGPIGLAYYKNIEKVIDESIKASILTHNYYIGFLGGMVTAVFTSFAMKNIPVYKWVEELIELYDKKIIEKYYPKEHNIDDLNDFIGYWKRYQETRVNKLKYGSERFMFPTDRMEYLAGFFPDPNIKKIVDKGHSLANYSWKWNIIGSSGLDCCIYAYDCLLLSMHNKDTSNTKTLDVMNVTYNINTFMTLVSIHPGDNDSTAAIGGTWIGALQGYDIFDKNRIKELEFYDMLKEVSKKLA